MSMSLAQSKIDIGDDVNMTLDSKFKTDDITEDMENLLEEEYKLDLNQDPVIQKSLI